MQSQAQSGDCHADDDVAGRVYLSPAQAARFLGLSPRTLERFRETGDGPTFTRIGIRRIAYARRDLDEWLSARRYRSTSEASVAADAV